MGVALQPSRFSRNPWRGSDTRMWLIVPLVLSLLFITIGGAAVGGIYADVLIPVIVIVMAATRHNRPPGRGG